MPGGALAVTEVVELMMLQEVPNMDKGIYGCNWVNRRYKRFEW